MLCEGAAEGPNDLTRELSAEGGDRIVWIEVHTTG